MSKRDLMERLLAEPTWDYVPAAFFTHFGEGNLVGNNAINKHLDFFHHTDMDFIKLQFEFNFPTFNFIKSPEDWLKVPRYDIDLFAEPLEIVDKIVRREGKEAYVIQTLYSPYSCAAAATSYDLITRHIEEDPEPVRKGLEIMADNLRVFTDECLRLGLDGFYACTQGGESKRFKDDSSFNVIKDTDLRLFRPIAEQSKMTILHVCDYWLKYDDIDKFTDYPCDIVSCPVSYASGQPISTCQVEELFGKIVLGGLDRKGAINGTFEEIGTAVQKVLDTASPRLILGADCTVANADWDKLRYAIALAHNYTRQ